jgi:hypothetical protein
VVESWATVVAPVIVAQVKIRQRLLIFALAGSMAVNCLPWVPALADNTVTLTIVGENTVQAYVVDGTLLPIDYANEFQQDTGELRLVTSDLRGTSQGWSVNIVSSDFVYHGESSSGDDIPNSGFRILVVTAPMVIAGQPRVEGGPNFDPLVGASLDIPRTVIWAAPGSGSGEYEQAIEVVLDIPLGSQAGTYIATLTVAFTSAP